MKQIKLNLNNQDEINKVAEYAAKILKKGGVVVYPTETLYGLGANAFNENAIAKVQNIKKQERSKPVSVVVKDIKMARRIACVDSKAERILNRIWPGPITIVLRKKDIIPYILTGGGETVAVRISDNKFISALFTKIDFPVTATSANISGENNLLEPEEIIEKLGSGEANPDIFINTGKIKNSIASTIIDLTTPVPRIVRMGIAGKDKLQEFFGKFNA
jgi:L-threonylcarbamoyladenylate synthase